MGEVEHQFSIPENPSSICSTGLLPHVLDGALLQVLRHHFSHPDNITQTALQCYVWDVDAKKRTMIVDPVYKWDVSTVQQRAAVLVKRGAWQTSRLSIGNTVHGPPPEVGYTRNPQLMAFTGSHMFFCVARTGTEAEELGAEVAYELLEFSQIIREQFNMHKFDLHQIGEVQRLDESHDHFAVPVSVSYGLVHTWAVLQQSPIWATFGLKLQQSDC